MASVVVAGALLRERQSSDLLDMARDTGAIGSTISKEYPQVLPSSGNFAGFDVSVVANLTSRMTLQPEVTPADPLTALEGGSWTVAVPSARINAGTRGTMGGVPAVLLLAHLRHRACR